MLLCWSAGEENSWNPVLARALREAGDEVVEAHTLDDLESIDPSSFDACLPRFRMADAAMACLDERLVRSGLPMVNSRRCRRACENKGISHLAFAEAGIPQPPSLIVSAEGFEDRSRAWEGETVVKPLYGNRAAGIEIFPRLDQACEAARRRGEDLLVQRMIWPARCWRVIVGRGPGVVDPYWRRPRDESDRVLSISGGAGIVRTPVPAEVAEVSERMLAAVEGDVLAADVLETDEGAFALELNHNFDAHGGTGPAARAIREEALRAARASRRPGTGASALSPGPTG